MFVKAIDECDGITQRMLAGRVYAVNPSVGEILVARELATVATQEDWDRQNAVATTPYTRSDRRVVKPSEVRHAK